MPRLPLQTTWLLTSLLAVAGLAGCRSSADVNFGDCTDHYQAFVQQIEYPDAECAFECSVSESAANPPPTLRRLDEIQYTPITLDEAIRLALTYNEVIRDAGGRVLSGSPDTTPTIYDVALGDTDPRFGTEAALAAFDAEFFTNLQFERRERRFNNFIFGGGALSLVENPAEFSAGFRKTAATGTQFSFENLTTYNRNNNPNNLFPSAYDTLFAANVRHPLLQGGGLEFNRIAGPGATPGNYRGVMIARLNNDILLADFETAVRNLLRDVELGYWELYFAYRDLDASLEGRNYALESWQLEKQRVDAETRPPDQEAFAREQFYAAQVSVENALSGGVVSAGVFGAERQLRSLLGLPATDGRLLRPSTPPLHTDIQYDWQESLGSALVRRVELRRQRWRVKQRELELVASRNFLRPRLDLIGQYNWRGFGDNLFGANSAIDDLSESDLEGWILGLELQSPIGYRLGHAAVRNAELYLRREQAILHEQERQVSLELRAAFTELDRAYAVSRSNYNRYLAAHTQLEAERRRNIEGATRLDLVLEAQRRLVISEIAFHRAIVDYNQAVSQLNLARGTLLDSLQVYLAEGPWPAETHASAARESARFQPTLLPRGMVPPPVSMGEYPQRIEEPTPAYAEEVLGAEPLPPPQMQALPPVEEP